MMSKPETAVDARLEVRVVPLTTAQRTFRFLHAMAEDPSICNEGVRFEIRGELDLDSLEGAFSDLVARHDSLRMAFPERSHAEALVFPTEHLDVRLEVIDLARVAPTDGRSDESRAAKREDIVEQVRRHAFDLDVPPLFRATLIREDATSHTLVVVCHHIVADGTSVFQRLPQELFERYAARVSGSVESPPELSYDSFRRWQDDQQTAPTASEHIEFWRSHLAEAPTLLQWPGRKPNPTVRAFRGVRVERKCPEALAATVQRLASSSGALVHDVLLAAWAAFLGRLADQQDVLVGSPVANRSRPEHSELIGCLVDERVFRVRMHDDPAFSVLVARVADERRTTRPHRDITIAAVLEAVDPPRDPPRPPLYQALFNYMPFGVAQVVAPALTVTTSRVPPVGAMLELSLEVVHVDGGITFVLELDLDWYRPEDAERLLGTYLHLLDAGVSEPATSFSRLPVTSSEDLQRLERRNSAPAPEGPDTTLAQLLVDGFEAGLIGGLQSAGRDSRGVSAAELRDRVARFAQLLVARGVGPGDRVAIWHEDPLRVVEAILAVLCAGAAYVPIAADAPLERVSQILADADPVLLLGGHVAPNDRCAHVRLDRVDLSAYPAEFPVLRTSPADPAYLLFTSGTTGRPKGVVVTQRNVVYQLRARNAVYDDPPTRFLLTYSFAFDASVAGLFWTLLHSGVLVVCPPELRLDPISLRRAVREHQISHLDAVPTVYAAMLSDASSEDFDSLRMVIVGGEALPVQVFEAHRRLLPEVRLFNEYGPTEATVFCSTIELGSLGVNGRIPIGGPIPGSRFYVTDSRGELVPIGHPGELWVGGPCVADGYWRAPNLNEGRFVDGRFRPGERVYRTGDRVRWLEDGTLEFLGRVDRQVKLRGVRFELDEVEAVLRTHAELSDAAVIVRDRALYAFVVSSSDSLTPRAVRRFLAERLPSTMVPSQVFMQGSLPMGPNGKVNHDGLVVHSTKTERSVHRALSDRERRVAKIWSELLGVTDIGPDDDFFELGGHSLLAVRMLQLVHEMTGLRIPVRSFFGASTLAELAHGRTAPQSDLRIVEPIRELGSAPPIFFVGSVQYPRALAAVLPDDIPVYGLNFFGLYDESSALPALTVESIAAAYLEEIRKVRPRGPVSLLGFCLESSIAYEIARRLLESGSEVSYLGLIDYFPNSSAPRRRLIRNNLRHTWDGLATRARGRVQLVRDQFTRSVTRAQSFGGRLLGRAPDTVATHVVMYERMLRAIDAYQLPRYPGEVELLVASEWTRSPRHPLIGLAGRVSFRRIEGTHEGFFQSAQLEQLASAIVLGARGVP